MRVRRRWPLQALVLMMLALLVTPANPAPAIEEDEGVAVLSITGLKPAIPKPGNRLRLSGTIRNVSTQPLADVRVLLRVSPQPLISRSEIADVLDGSTNRQGFAFFETFSQVATELAPGADTTWRLQARLDSLGLSGNGVYAVFVESYANVGGAETLLGRSSTVLPWFPATEDIQPSSLTTLWPLTAPVALDPDNQFLNRDFVAAISPGGRLDAQLRAASRTSAPLTWVVDPAVVSASAVAGTGSSVGPTEELSPADRANAQAWSARLREALGKDNSVTRLLPYAQVDAESLTLTGEGDVVADAINRSRPGPSRLPGLVGLIADSVTGATTQRAVRTYRQNGVAINVVSDTYLRPAQPLNYTPTGLKRWTTKAGESDMVIVDSALSDLLPDLATDSAERLQARQAMLADTAMITLERPQDPRTVALQPPAEHHGPARWTGRMLDLIDTAPWISMVPLADLVKTDDDLVVRDRDRTFDQPPPLPTDYVRQVGPIQDRIEVVNSILREPGSRVRSLEAATLRAVSQQWRSDVAGGQLVMASVDDALEQVENSVTVVTQGSVNLTGTQGKLPLTIANDYDQAVRVGVVLDADPEFRLQYDPPPAVTVQPGRRRGLEIEVQIAGSGDLPVEILLVDRDGRPMGDPVMVTLGSSATTMIAIIVMGLGGIGLAILIVVRFVRGNRAGAGPRDQPVDQARHSSAPPNGAPDA